jgi:uncharacterized protein with HEPN domain
LEREYRDYLEDIIHSISKTDEFVKGMTFEDFSADDKTIFAVVRALEIIGEAAKMIPVSIRNRHTDIPWREITGMRDKLTHAYFGVELEAVWNTIKNDIPKIDKQFRKMLKGSEK